VADEADRQHYDLGGLALAVGAWWTKRQSPLKTSHSPGSRQTHPRSPAFDATVETALLAPARDVDVVAFSLRHSFMVGAAKGFALWPLSLAWVIIFRRTFCLRRLVPVLATWLFRPHKQHETDKAGGIREISICLSRMTNELCASVGWWRLSRWRSRLGVILARRQQLGTEIFPNVDRDNFSCASALRQEGSSAPKSLKMFLMRIKAEVGYKRGHHDRFLLACNHRTFRSNTNLSLDRRTGGSGCCKCS